MAARDGRTVGQAYAAAGVDIDSASRAKDLIRKHARSTFRPEVLTDIGAFSGLFRFSGAGYEDPVLSSSTDGVGTKIRIAIALDKHDTVGADLVNHCINDILTCGAEPLFFLDYIAAGKVVPEQVESVVRGLAGACKDAGCALIGGETAEMPGVYAIGDYDLAGFIIGVVDRSCILDGKSIAAGDILVGLPSSGLHTNGYSLARKIFGDDKKSLETYYPELGRTIGEALLDPHRCYLPRLKPLLPRNAAEKKGKNIVKGLAHITGGGILDNLPRSLPQGTGANINANSWDVPPLFDLIRRKGNVDRLEMYRVFNMGIGMIVVCSPGDASRLLSGLPEGKVIGEVVERTVEPRVMVG